jgi:hypothetical protein
MARSIRPLSNKLGQLRHLAGQAAPILHQNASFADAKVTGKRDVNAAVYAAIRLLIDPIARKMILYVRPSRS